MLYEYAVEPEAIGGDWETFRYVIEKFGFDRGRLISRFPEGWETRVIEIAEAAKMPPVRLSSLVNRLRKTKSHAMIPNTRKIDLSINDWLESAIDQHGQRPFQAIVVGEDGTEHEAVLEVDSLTDESPRFAASISWEVERTGDKIADALLPVVAAANEIMIVDPYFDISSPQFRAPLKKLLARRATFGGPGCGFQIHYKERPDKPSTEGIEREARSWTNGVIPGGYWLEFFAWKKRIGGEDFHDRYVLCDCGGISMGAGFRATGAHERLALTLLSIDDCALKRSRFKAETAAYDQVGPVLRINPNGTTRRIG